MNTHNEVIHLDVATPHQLEAWEVMRLAAWEDYERGRLWQGIRNGFAVTVGFALLAWSVLVVLASQW